MGIAEMLVVIIIAAVVGVTVFRIVVGQFAPSTDEIEFYGGSEKRSKHKLAQRTEKLKERLVTLLNRFVPMSKGDRDSMKLDLWRAGLSSTTLSYHAFSIGFTAIFCVVGVAVAIFATPGTVTPNDVVIGVFLIVVGIAAPRLLLILLAHKRKEIIMAELPVVLEMLSSAVAAGLTVERGFAFVAEKTTGPLSQEFAQVDREIRVLGVDKDEALRGMAERCNVSSVSMFVSALVQAMNQGASMSDILKAQARRVRDQYYQEVEIKANKAATKMLFPMAFLILPTLFIIILVPPVLTIISSFSQM